MVIHLHIKNFNSIVKRRDIKKPNWFSVENDIFSHPDFFRIPPEYFRVFIWVLAVGSKVNSEKIHIDTELCAHQLQAKHAEVVASIEHFNGKRWDVTNTFSEQNADVTDTSRARSESVTYTTNRTDNTDTTNKTLEGVPLALHWTCQVWNEHRKDLPEVKSDRSRQKRIKDAVKLFPNREDWVTAVKNLAESPFCNGDNDRGWRADFDFLLNPKSFGRALENSYARNKTAKASGKTNLRGYENERQDDWLSPEQLNAQAEQQGV